MANQWIDLRASKARYSTRLEVPKRRHCATMDRFFSLDLPFSRFAANTLILSCVSLIPLLLFYVALTPGFGSMLLENGPALRRFLRQVLTNGIPVVFAVNYLSFFLYAVSAKRQGTHSSPILILIVDLPARIFVFVALHAFIYFVSADWFGSFGGDRWQALRVVSPTLARSAMFENISGVYLYATIISAVPLYLNVISVLLAGEGRVSRRIQGKLAWLGKGGIATLSVLSAFVYFGLFTLLLTALANLIVALQTP
jgi:hypothetical protein